MKVVINDEYGGFGMSDEAEQAYAERKGIRLYSEPSRYFDGHTNFYLDEARTQEFTAHDLCRFDPDLVAVVEELGTDANDGLSRLIVVDVPAGSRFRIADTEGKEEIEIRDELEWFTAT